MCDTGYTVRDLAADLRDLKTRGLDDASMLREASELVKRLVLMKHNWLRGYMTTLGEGKEAARHVLHEEPDHSLALFVITAGPGRESPPHDHGTWAVIAGLEGSETQRLWRRSGGDEVERADESPIDAATVVTLDSDTIHSMHNDSNAAAVTLQLYGTNVDFTEHRTYTPRRPS
ncbi:MAG TPA: cysteine dioxygenase family protein [Usitatibacter sp.]|nr:cysteine dioxygenase family protein [Usitatibacter sp.]